MPSFRTLLVLGRVSNLPTVWSNCLAGWWLGGGGNLEKLPLLFFGATFLYTGGMYLNDAFDADFDRQHRRDRPIPSGAITLSAVWRIGFFCLAAGIACLGFLGPTAAAIGIVLSLCILIYDAVHKAVVFSPMLMGVCRTLLYALAAATAVNGVTGRALWCGVALGVYVVGLSVFARREAFRGIAPHWPLALLVAPIALALLMNVGPYREAALLISLVLGLWLMRCLRTVFWSREVQMGRAVSGLLAGIVFVDWLAVAPEMARISGIWFLLLFGLALLFQRFAPAT